MTTVAALKAAVCERVDEIADELVDLSHAVHRFAEPAFEEHRSAAAVAALASRHGLSVRRPVAGLKTAFVAESGSDGPIVAIFAEYDALPGLGHACGHNVIAAAGAGAAIALHALGGRPGRVRLIGSPAEERGGGKIILARAGFLHGVRAAMLIHPNAFETARPHIIAALHLRVRTLGRAAHATLFPERGINALDGLILGLAGLWSIRAGLPHAGQVHGVLVQGGTSPGVIPDRAEAAFLVRAATLAGLTPVADRVLRTLAGGAASVGAGLRVRATAPAYAELRTDPELALAWERNARSLGRQPLLNVPPNRVGSSDLGNVSHLVPTIHPMLAIADGDTVPHTPGFAAAAISDRADRAVLDGAKAMAMTAIDELLQ
ncbi:peptidase M20 [Rhizocola hellebori]|uniref:Peptidase M20 domain-containing protein 2 n=1 Tax=Rhizocola hellebori TaxID=1392758 RepID=A0A8J3QBY4_9ACTN|nr:amidohydrolase [Rhizocola hellebori]GIH06922.1 peptidase M20 [Rhizocola hellebori]